MKKNYEIIEYSEELIEQFCACLTPEDKTIGDSGRMKEDWVRRRTKNDFGALFAKTQDGKLCGMVQYIPIEESGAEGKGLWFVFCIWIPPAKRNSAGKQRKKGIGRALIEAAEQDVRNRGANGLAVWGTPLPFFMQSSFFKKLGFVQADKTGIQELLWKPFTPEADAPKWRGPGKDVPEAAEADKVEVTSFISGICPAMNAVHLRFAKACADLAPDAVLKTVDTSSREAVTEWGRTDAVYIDGKDFPTGPPPGYRKIYRTLKKAIKEKSLPQRRRGHGGI